jgi:hypothetical protein
MGVQERQQLEFFWEERRAEASLFPAPPAPGDPDDDAVRTRLESAIGNRTGLRVDLTVTNNTSTMMSVKYDRSRTHARVRLHHMFLSAPAEVVDALAAWVQSPRTRKAGRLLDAYIRGNSHHVRRTIAGSRETRGTHCDLQALFDEVNGSQFSNAVTAAIAWGRVPEARRRRSIRFGSYYPREDLIRIHPFLDQAFVPPYFVRYIVFHEMLHAHLGIEESPSGRQRIHTAAFKKIEQAYPDYARAVAWQNDPKNLRKLLSGQTAKKMHLERWFGGIGEAIAGVLP